MLWVLGDRVFVECSGCDRLVELCMEDVEDTEGDCVVQYIAGHLAFCGLHILRWSVLVHEF